MKIKYLNESFKYLILTIPLLGVSYKAVSNKQALFYYPIGLIICFAYYALVALCVRNTIPIRIRNREIVKGGNEYVGQVMGIQRLYYQYMDSRHDITNIRVIRLQIQYTDDTGVKVVYSDILPKWYKYLINHMSVKVYDYYDNFYISLQLCRKNQCIGKLPMERVKDTVECKKSLLILRMLSVPFTVFTLIAGVGILIIYCTML